MIMANEFKPTVGNPISKADAEKWIEKFDKERKKDTKSVFYGRNAIEAILSDTRASGISFFFVRKYDDKAKKDIDDIVMVGTMEDGTLLWDGPTTQMRTANGGGTSQTYDGSSTCPPYCPIS
jgi:hypothetical protein